MKKVSLLFAFMLAFGVRHAVASDCLAISDVEKPGHNFAIFLETLESALENRCPNEPRESGDMVDFEFGQKGEFEVVMHHIPGDCPTFGVVGDLTCDPYDTPKCHSVGKFMLTPNPESAKKLAKRVAEKINIGQYEETDCGLDMAD